MNRTTQLLEAVLSGYETVTPKQLQNILDTFHQLFMQWSAGQLNDPIGALNRHRIMQQARVMFLTSDDPDIHPHVLFDGGYYDNDGDYVVIHLSKNFFQARMEWMRNNRGYEPLHPVEMRHHMAVLKSMLVHEFIHREQWKREAAARAAKGLPPPPYRARSPIGRWNAPVQVVKWQVQANYPGMTMARAVPTGPHMTGDNWYMGQPEELMAWAAQLSQMWLRFRKQGRPDITATENLKNYMYTVRSRLMPSSSYGDDNPALKRFKKYVMEYLLRHAHLDPQVATDEMNHLFSMMRQMPRAPQRT